MAMDAVILCEFASEATGARAGLLDRIAPLSLSGEGRLGFVATGRGGEGEPATEIVAVAFAKAQMADKVLLRWRSDPAFPAAVTIRLMRIEPIWAIEPLALMFP